MRELQRKLDHDAKLQQFLSVKGQQHRVNAELEARENNKRRQQQEDLEHQMEEYSAIIEKIKVGPQIDGELLTFRAKEMNTLFLGVPFFFFVIFISLLLISHALFVLRFLFQNFSTEEDVERLAGQFKKQEEENFALFNYVNELSHEVETLNEIVHQLRENIGE